MTRQQQRTVERIAERMREDGWAGGTDDLLSVRPLAEEAAEFGNFSADEVEAAGAGAVVVLRAGDAAVPDPHGDRFEVPDRGLAIDRDGAIVALEAR